MMFLPFAKKLFKANYLKNLPLLVSGLMPWQKALLTTI